MKKSGYLCLVASLVLCVVWRSGAIQSTPKGNAAQGNEAPKAEVVYPFEPHVPLSTSILGEPASTTMGEDSDTKQIPQLGEGDKTAAAQPSPADMDRLLSQCVDALSHRITKENDKHKKGEKKVKASIEGTQMVMSWICAGGAI